MRSGARIHHRLFAALLALGLASVLVNARDSDFVGPPAPDDLTLDDPFPIRRVLLTKDRIALEIERAKSGILVRLSRSEFEKRVREASRRARTPSETPQLMEAHYRARLLRDGLDENSLTGTAEWKVVNKGGAMGLLPIDALQVAVNQARWTDNRPATIGLLDRNSAAGLELLVDQAGEQVLALDWSCRGIPEPDAIRFDLLVPPSPIASLDLELPTDIKPVIAQEELLLSGPFAVDDMTKRQSWRISFGGLSHVEISLRRDRPEGKVYSPLQTTLTSRHDLFPGSISSLYSFEFRVLRSDVSELLIDYDADLTLTELNVLNLESWSPQTDIVKGRKRIIVHLREPTRGGYLRVAATSSLPFKSITPWVSPSMQIVGAISQTETVRLNLRPDVRLVELYPESFRLLRTEFTADRAQLLTLESSFIANGPSAFARPKARFEIKSTEFSVRQKTEWNIGTDRSSLDSELIVSVLHGELNLLAFRLPATWEIDQVEGSASEPSPPWTLQNGQNPVLQVELPSTLKAGGEGRIRVKLHKSSSHLAKDGRHSIPFPDLAPLGSLSRQGEYRIRASSAFRVSAPEVQGDEDGTGPFLPLSTGDSANLTYPFNGHPPAGPLILEVRRPRFTVRNTSTLSLESGFPALSTRLDLNPETGVLPSIAFFTTEPVAMPWIWRTIQGKNRVSSVEPLCQESTLTALGGIAARTPLELLLRAQYTPSGQWWKLTFTRPLDEPISIQASYEPAAKGLTAFQQRLRAISLIGARNPFVSIANLASTSLSPVPTLDRLPLPLVRIPDAASTTGSLTVDLQGGAWKDVQTTGMFREMTQFINNSWKTLFRFSDRPPTMVLLSGSNMAGQSTALIDGVQLTIVAGSGDNNRCHLRFRIHKWPDNTLNVRLPKNAELLEAMVGRQSLSRDRCQVEKNDETVGYSIPVYAREEWRTVELLYSVPARPWELSATLEACLPQFPIHVSDVQIRWRLAPGIMPLREEAFARSPGGPDKDRHLRYPWLRSLFGYAMSSTPLDSPSRSVAPIAKGNASSSTLQHVLFGLAAVNEKPIVDTVALAEQSLQFSTRILNEIEGKTNWESLGLIIVPLQRGSVLTTLRQQSIWRADAGPIESLPRTVTDAIEEAIDNGRDSTGRFRSIGDWIETMSDRDNSPLLARLGGDGPGWTAWEQLRANEPIQIQVVNTTHIALTGWLLAGILTLLGVLILGRAVKAGILFLLIWLLASSCSLILLPNSLRGISTGPLFIALLIAIVSVCLRRIHSRNRSVVAASQFSKQRAAILATALAMVFALGHVGQAMGPEPSTVYLLPGSMDNRTSDSVLAPPELLDKLAATANPSAPLTDSAFLRGRFSGIGEVDGPAEFEANFDLVSFVQQTTISLPIADVRFREVLLDGAAAFPKPMGEGRYIIDLKGKGVHRLDVKFTAPVTGQGPDRNVQFSSSELAICHLKFKTTEVTNRLQALNWRGAQFTSEGGKEIHADLGRTRTIHVRWQKKVGTIAAQVRVQEASVWSLRPSDATLYSVFDYRITQGSITTLRLRLPQNVEVARVEVHPDAVVNAPPPSWIKNWITGPDNVLRIELQAALTGSVRLVLECLPTKPLGNIPVLMYPSTLDAMESEAFVAFRLLGLDTAGDFEKRGVTEFSADSFFRDFWRSRNVEKTPMPVTRAFRRVKTEVVSLKPSLRLSPRAISGTHELIWHLEPHGAQVHGNAQWNSGSSLMSMVEWEVPASVTVHDVRGLRLHSWLRTGNRIFAWLREPSADVALVWHGVWSHPGAVSETMNVDIPVILLGEVKAQTTIQRLRPPIGWTLAQANIESIGVPLTPLVSNETALQLLSPRDPGRYQLRPPQADGSFRIFSAVDVIGSRLSVNAHITPILRRERPHSFVIVAQGVKDWQIKIQSASACKIASQPTSVGRREWMVEVPAREMDLFSIDLLMEQAAEATREVAIPRIQIMQGERPTTVDQHLLLLGPEIREAKMQDFQRVSNDRPNVNFMGLTFEYQRLRERGGSLWRASGSDALALLRVSTASFDFETANRVALAEIEAAELGNHWLYRASFDLVYESDVDLSCLLPAGAVLEGLALDGDVKPLPAAGKMFNVLLPPGPGTHLLQIVWSNPDANWEVPRLTSLGRLLPYGTTIGTAYVQHGHRIEVNGLLSAQAMDLHRADALLSLMQRGLTGMPNDQDGCIADRALLSLLLADSRSAQREDSAASERGPDGRLLSEWLNSLKQKAATLRESTTNQELTHKDKSISLCIATYQKLPYADRFKQGTPYHWSMGQEAPIPEVRLRSSASKSFLSTFVALCLIVVCLSLFGLLAFFVRSSAWAEQIALIGLLGFIAFGFNDGLVYLLLTGVAFIIRFIWAGRKAIDWFESSRSKPLILPDTPSKQASSSR